jgi:hypothetical protein
LPTPSPNPRLTTPKLGDLAPSQPTYSPPTASPARPWQPTPEPIETAQDAKAWAQRNLTPDEYTALYWIVWSESKWDPAAVNRSSGACGLGQFWPCSKMADSLPNWPTEPIAQLRDYVIPYAVNKYGSLQGAWLMWQRRGWW